jgi:putative endonuclease
MSENIEIGATGENAAVDYLRESGYKILETNWRYKHKEIDIIACTPNSLVVVEVKSRSNDYFELPQEAVTRKKQRFIIEATNAYIEKFNINQEVRFDIITVMFKNEQFVIEHIPDAFYPGINTK